MIDADNVLELAPTIRRWDPAFADELEEQSGGIGTPEAEARIKRLVESWVDHFVDGDPYRKYRRLVWYGMLVTEDGVVRLAAETARAFLAYAEGITDLTKTPAEHQKALEELRDAKRREVFGETVAKVEQLAMKAGLRVRRAGFTRALERAVPVPKFTVDYLHGHDGNAGSAAAEGALVGTAAMPVIGTVIGGLMGWAGSRLAAGHSEPSLETQKAWIVQAASIVLDTIEEHECDASPVMEAQIPYTEGAVPPAEELDGLNRLFQWARPFLPEGAG